MRLCSASVWRAGPRCPGRTSVDPLQVDRVLDALVEIDWVGRLAEPDGARHVLLCDPATTRAAPLIAKLLLDPAPDLAPTWKRAGFDAMRLEEMLRPAAPRP